MDLSDVPTFAYDENYRFANNTVYFLTGEENILFLLGYLNSKLAAYLFSQIGSTSGVGTTRWPGFTLERLLVPRCNVEMQSEMVRLVDRILNTRKTAPSAGTFAVEREIDSLVYRLCKLSEEEITRVEN